MAAIPLARIGLMDCGGARRMPIGGYLHCLRCFMASLPGVQS